MFLKNVPEVKAPETLQKTGQKLIIKKKNLPKSLLKRTGFNVIFKNFSGGDNPGTSSKRPAFGRYDGCVKLSYRDIFSHQTFLNPPLLYHVPYLST